MKLIRTEIEFGIRIFWPPAIVVVVYAVVLALGIYAQYPWLDKVYHFWGGFSVGLSAWFLLRHWQQSGLLGSVNQWLKFFLIVVIASFVALMWECFEFVLDQLFGHSHQASLVDTMADLSFGVLGAILAAGLVWFISIKKQDTKKPYIDTAHKRDEK